jgi:hypothetical protein
MQNKTSILLKQTNLLKQHGSMKVLERQRITHLVAQGFGFNLREKRPEI